MISFSKPNYFKNKNNLSKFFLIFFLSLQSASFAQAKTLQLTQRLSQILLSQNENAKPGNTQGSAGASKLTGAEQTLKDEVKLEKSWMMDKKKEDAIGKLISALDQKAHEKKNEKAKKSKKVSQSFDHKKVKQTRGKKNPQPQPSQESDPLFDDLFDSN